MEETGRGKLSEYEFVVKAIKKLRKPPYRGIHSVYSGFNQAFREYFEKNPVEVTTDLAKQGKIATRPVKGGVILYLPEDAPSFGGAKGILDRILQEDDSLEDQQMNGHSEIDQD